MLTHYLALILPSINTISQILLKDMHPQIITCPPLSLTVGHPFYVSRNVFSFCQTVFFFITAKNIKLSFTGIKLHLFQNDASLLIDTEEQLNQIYQFSIVVAPPFALMTPSSQHGLDKTLEAFRRHTDPRHLNNLSHFTKI